MTYRTDRPGRPFGLTLAIILSVFLYSILPLFQLGIQLFVQDRLSRIDSPVTFEGQVLESLGSGGDQLVSTAEIIVNGGTALVFLAIAVFAWRGGYSWIRSVFTAAILFLASLTAYVSIRALLTPANLEQGISSADTLVRALLSGRLTATVLVPLYVIWYINRAPARAFFRGYYDKSAG